ncbi:MAG: MATE family efflux transporter [Bacillota bacterium]|nr:MATE family efflux transporter [Bacillota bacterium]
MNIQLSDHFTYKKLLRFSVAPIVMMVLTSIYGVVDGLFVSNFVGKTAFASLNLIYPYIMLIGGAGFMIGTGGSALVAKTLGEGKRATANRYFTMLVIFIIIFGAVLAALGIIFIRPVAYKLGATEAMIENCVNYGRIVLGFNVAFMLQNAFQTFFITAEKPELGLMTTITAGLTNVMLDALFIAVFEWGIEGAALATGLSQCVGGVLPIIYFLLSKKSLLRFTKTRLELRPIVKACTNGVSELMANVSGATVSMLYNFQLMRFAGENGVAAYGVIMYVEFIFVATFIGYAISAAPIVAYHYGAENHDELKNILRKSVVLTLGTGTVMMLLAQLSASVLAKIFVGYDSELFAMTNHALRIFSLAFVLSGINIYASSFFTALNNGAVSAVISFMRTLVFQLLSVLILPIFFGIDGIWSAIVVAEVFALIISSIFLITKRKKYHYM